MKSFILGFFVLVFCNSNIFSQQNNFFSEGVYDTFSDFVLNKPVSKGIFEAKVFSNTHNFKIKNENGKLERKAFAVCNSNGLYVNVKGINENLINEDRIILSGSDRTWAYSKALYSNELLIYFEIDDVSKSYGIIGIGIVGLRGVIYQKTTSKFRVLKTNVDVSEFLRHEKPELLEKYDLLEKGIIEINLVREIVKKVFL